MFKVIIKNLQGQQTHGASFPTELEAQSWIDSLSSSGAWGKLDRWLTEDGVLSEGLSIEEATESRKIVTQEFQAAVTETLSVEVLDENGMPLLDEQGNPQFQEEIRVITPEVPEISYMEHFYPAEFTIEIEDITAAIAYEKSISTNLARMEFGKRLMAELAASNQSDLIQGALTLEQVIEAEASLATIQRLILNGSLGLAAQMLQTTQVPHLSEQKKAYFLNKMQGYLASEL